MLPSPPQVVPSCPHSNIIPVLSHTIMNVLVTSKPIHLPMLLFTTTISLTHYTAPREYVPIPLHCHSLCFPTSLLPILSLHRTTSTAYFIPCSIYFTLTLPQCIARSHMPACSAHTRTRSPQPWRKTGNGNFCSTHNLRTKTWLHSGWFKTNEGSCATTADTVLRAQPWLGSPPYNNNPHLSMHVSSHQFPTRRFLQCCTEGRLKRSLSFLMSPQRCRERTWWRALGSLDTIHTSLLYSTDTHVHFQLQTSFTASQLQILQSSRECEYKHLTFSIWAEDNSAAFYITLWVLKVKMMGDFSSNATNDAERQ